MRRLVLQEDMKHWTPDQASDQPDQDGWATGTPCQEAGGSPCRRSGDQENAGRDTETDRPASSGTWLACFESTGIYDSYGVVQRQLAAPRERLGQRQAILGCYA